MTKVCKGIQKEKFLELVSNQIHDSVIFTEALSEMIEEYGDDHVLDNSTNTWNRLEDIVGKDISLLEALEYARKGCFVTSSVFSTDQSMHYWNGKFYYEDGAVVPTEFLDKEDWAHDMPWRVVATKEQVDLDKLNKMHVDSHGYMLERNSYMECIKKIAISEENTWLQQKQIADKLRYIN